jgi:AraC-like DNA-binding protein
MILDIKFSPYFKKIERNFEIEYIGCAFERKFEESFDFSGESHSFLEAVYVDEGNVEVVENERVYLMSAGDIIFHAPMEFHRIKSDKGTSPRVYNLSALITGKVTENVYGGVFRLDELAKEEFLRIFGLAKDFLDDEPSAFLGGEVADAFGAFILRVCREFSPNSRIISDSGAMLYRSLAKTMQNRVCDNITLEKVAKENHISLSYLKTVFRTYANTSPKNYYTKLRVAEAARLLSLGDSAAFVAEKMNFSSSAYFTAFFKKNMGVCPSEYKKSISRLV